MKINIFKIHIHSKNHKYNQVNSNNYHKTSEFILNKILRELLYKINKIFNSLNIN